MEKEEQPKKCFCARCFLPICPEDKVDIDGQSFHRLCSTCCICRTIPTSLKMFYGHVFCTECFNTHVLTRFRGESPRIHSNSWWMQWAPGVKPQQQPQANETSENENKDEEQKGPQKAEEAPEPPKRCTCARCLQAVDESSRILIDGQSFHPMCAKCYFCHRVPTTNVKIYYGQVFCEDCFNRYVLSHNKDNPTEFFRTCFEQWQNNAHFAENMREFMSGNKDAAAPFVFMMQPQQFCRCGGAAPHAHDNMPTEQKKSATPVAMSIEEGSTATRDLSFENRTEISDIPESYAAIEDSYDSFGVAAAEKIEKLTKYLHERRVTDKSTKKWKNFEYDQISTLSDQSFYAWVDLQDPKASARSDCPKCLWQCGPIYVNSDIFQREVCCEEN